MSNLTEKMRLFHKAKGDFGRVFAIQDRDVMLPGAQKLTSFLLMI